MNRRQFSLVIGLVLPLAGLLVLLSWMPGGPVDTWQPVARAQGTVITVTTDLDNGTPGDGLIVPAHCDDTVPPACSLREAIVRANEIGSDVHITFDQPYTITLTYRGTSGTILPLDSNDTGGSVYLDSDNLSIDGDLDDNCTPDVVINGENITVTAKSGLRLAGDGGTIEGLVIQNFRDYGISLAGGDNLTITCSYIGTDVSGRQPAPNRLGIYIQREAFGNVISNNVIAGNSQNGIQVSALPSTSTVNIPYSNTISSNWIGTNPFGDPLGNANKGVLIQHSSRDNLVFDNEIRYNGCYGVHLRGRYAGKLLSREDDFILPPRGNQVISNTIAQNNINACPGASVAAARAGLVSEDTHLAISNTLPSLVAGDYDNLISDNVISGNGGFGIYNLGASPLITGNVVQGSVSDGINTQVEYSPDFSPERADEDILSVPIMQGNAVQNNGRHGIYSLDTAPVDPYQLHIANTVQNNGEEDVNQLWYGLIEVLGGYITNPVPLAYAAPILLHPDYPSYQFNFLEEISVGVPYNSTLWGDQATDDYFNVTTWQAVPQFVVTGTSNLEDYSPQEVILTLTGLTATFSFDGLTSTHRVITDLIVPSYVETGPFGRYQVAQVNAFLGSGDGDQDDDSIPDQEECPEGPPCEDSDGDGIPDYLDPDDDGDGIDTVDECPGGPPCDDSDGDGIPDYLDPDDDGDGINTEDECPGGPPCDDTDGDGIPDYLDPDDDGDGINTEDECPGGPPCADTDGDGTPDYLDPDDDGDGILTADECPGGPPCADSDGDGTPDYLDPDDDGDGVNTADECPTGPPCADSDGDGTPDYLDPDDDDDGILTDVEYDWCGTAPCDMDGDGTPDYLDEDSDGDGTPDSEEYGECNAGDANCVCNFGDPPACYVDSDGDGKPDWLDPNYALYLPIVMRNA